MLSGSTAAHAEPVDWNTVTHRASKDARTVATAGDPRQDVYDAVVRFRWQRRRVPRRARRLLLLQDRGWRWTERPCRCGVAPHFSRRACAILRWRAPPMAAGRSVRSRASAKTIGSYPVAPMTARRWRSTRATAAHIVWPTLVNDTTPQKAIFYTSTTRRPLVCATNAAVERRSGRRCASANRGRCRRQRRCGVGRATGRYAGASSCASLQQAAASFDAPRALNDGTSAFHPHIVGVQRRISGRVGCADRRPLGHHCPARAARP